jgi:multicomponent Na+:H+ antiporter subunit D
MPPLHSWLPDAYPEASVAGTVFLSAYTTKAAVYALARGFPGVELLLWLGVAMAIYGVTYAMLENDIRRLLSYHIVSQVGFMVAAIGVGTEYAINGAVAHAFAHILYKGLLLMGVGAVIHATGRSKMTALGGLGNGMRGVFTLYMIGAVSISSLPLFSGFVSKEMSVSAVSAEGFAVAVILLKVVSVGTFLSTGLKLPFGTWFGSEGAGPRDLAAHPRLTVGPVPVSMFVAMGIGAGLNLLIGVYPPALYDLLPHTVEYVPYSVGKVIEKLQILGFTALGFWILIDRLQAKPKISRDVDWLYRRLPKLVTGRSPSRAGRTGGAVPARTPLGEAQRAGRSVARAQGRLEHRLPAMRGSEPPLYPTWVLGTVLLGTIVLLLILTLATS